jgi:hypothetical protein
VNEKRELEKQVHLLQVLYLDLQVISKIKIHPEFLSQWSEKQWRPERKVVADVRMRQVGGVCATTHGMLPLDSTSMFGLDELRGRFQFPRSLWPVYHQVQDFHCKFWVSGLPKEFPILWFQQSKPVLWSKQNYARPVHRKHWSE